MAYNVYEDWQLDCHRIPLSIISIFIFTLTEINPRCVYIFKIFVSSFCYFKIPETWCESLGGKVFEISIFLTPTFLLPWSSGFNFHFCSTNYETHKSRILNSTERTSFQVANTLIIQANGLYPNQLRKSWSISYNVRDWLNGKFRRNKCIIFFFIVVKSNTIKTKNTQTVGSFYGWHRAKATCQPPQLPKYKRTGNVVY